MPWSVSESPLGRRLPVQANATGGYSRVSTPNPNSGMSTFNRNNTGAAISPINTAMLGQTANEADMQDTAAHDAYLAGEARSGKIDTVGSGQMDRMNKSMQSASPWRLMLQSLKNAGTGGLRTGAAAGMDPTPGFFDTQASSLNPSLGGVLNARQQQQTDEAADPFGMANYGRKQSQIRKRI